MAHPVIELAGVTFNTEQPDADGCRWNMPIPKGWASPSVQVDVSEPTIAPGGDQAVNRRHPWPLVARWIVRAPNRSAAYAAWERCQQMPGDGLGSSTALVVHTPTPKWLQVIQTDCDVDEPIDGRLVVAEVDLLALYPFKRGVDERSAPVAPGATVTLENAGTKAAPLTITATGPGTVRMRMFGSGQLLQTRTTVGTGTVFNCFEQTVFTAGGVEVFPMASPSEWLSIPGRPIGATSEYAITNQGTAPVTVSWFDTY